MKNLLSIAIAFSSFVGLGQFGLGVGPSTMFQFGNNKPFAGLNVALELPRDYDQTYMCRLNYLLPQRGLETNDFVFAIDPNTTPYTLPITEREQISYFNADFGTRFYFINGYDDGFSLYLGTSFGVSFNTVRFKTSDYDKTKYQTAEQSTQQPGTSFKDRGTILAGVAGFNFGLKHTFAGRGTLYFDMYPSYNFLELASNNVAAATTMYSRVNMMFNIGFRKEFY